MAVVKLAVDGLYLYTSTPYDPDFVEALKLDIPSSGRRWLADDKLWRVEKLFEFRLLSLLKEFFDTVERVPLSELSGAASGRSGYRPGANGGADSLRQDYATLHLLPSAPAEVVKAVYRTLAKLKHPDAGGTTADMQHINAAYERIDEKERRR